MCFSFFCQCAKTSPCGDRHLNFVGCLWAPLLLLAPRIHLRRLHLHHQLGTEQNQKTEAAGETLGCDHVALGPRPTLLLVAGCFFFQALEAGAG